MLALSALAAPSGIRSPTQGVELVYGPDALSCQVRPSLFQWSVDHRFVLCGDYRSITPGRCNTRSRSSVDHIVCVARPETAHEPGRFAAVDASSTISSWATSHWER